MKELTKQIRLIFEEECVINGAQRRIRAEKFHAQFCSQVFFSLPGVRIRTVRPVSYNNAKGQSFHLFADSSAPSTTFEPRKQRTAKENLQCWWFENVLIFFCSIAALIVTMVQSWKWQLTPVRFHVSHQVLGWSSCLRSPTKRHAVVRLGRNFHQTHLVIHGSTTLWLSLRRLPVPMHSPSVVSRTPWQSCYERVRRH